MLFNSIFGRTPRTPLDDAEAAIRKGNNEELAKAAKKIADLGLPYLVEPLILIADRLAQDPAFLPKAYEAYYIAKVFSSSDSDLEPRAKEGCANLLAVSSDLRNRNVRIKFHEHGTEPIRPTPTEAKGFVERVSSVIKL